MIELYGWRLDHDTLMVAMSLLSFHPLQLLRLRSRPQTVRVQGDNVTVVVDISDFELVDKLGQENVEGGITLHGCSSSYRSGICHHRTRTSRAS
jgi:hypothetical protein